MTPYLEILSRHWPLVALPVVFLVALLLTDLWTGVATVLLSMLVVGPLYLVQQSRRRHQYGLVPPDISRNSQSIGHSQAVVWDAALALGLLIVAATNAVSHWLGGIAFTFIPLLLSGMSLSYALWSASVAAASRGEARAIKLRRAAVALIMVVGTAALTAAIANARTQLLGDSWWSLASLLIGVVAFASAAARLLSAER